MESHLQSRKVDILSKYKAAARAVYFWLLHTEIGSSHISMVLHSSILDVYVGLVTTETVRHMMCWVRHLSSSGAPTRNVT